MGIRRGTRPCLAKPAGEGGPGDPCWRSRAPRHRVPGRHRRQGEAQGHGSRARDRRRHARARADAGASSGRWTRRSSTTPGDILFVGNVGEEGEGDLRGVKFLLQAGQVTRTASSRCMPIDGDVSQLGHRDGGVGSLRYRVTFKGPGGHSYGAFGLVNPAFAMGSAMAKFGRLKVPATRRRPSTSASSAAAPRSTRFPST